MKLCRSNPFRWLAGIVLVALLATGWQPAGVAGQGVATALFEPVIPSQRAEIEDDLAGTLSSYVVAATLAPADPATGAPASISGHLDLDWVNLTGETVTTLPFRLYPNAEVYAEGSMAITRATAGGRDLALRLDPTGVTANLDLAEPVVAGATAGIAIDWETTLPTDPDGGYGMFGYDTATGTYAMAHWLPLVAGWDPATGWELGPFSANGDPIFSNTALFSVALTAPAELAIASSGEEVAREGAGETATWRFASGPMRDFVLAASANWEVTEQVVGETRVRSFWLAGDEAGGAAVLATAASALTFFDERIGTYPWTELDLVEVAVGRGAAGIEFPGLIFIGSGYYSEQSMQNRVDFLDFITVHEVTHQWFYGVVGNNQYQHAFIDEGLANALSVAWFAWERGPEAATRLRERYMELPYVSMLYGDGGDQVVDTPTDLFPSEPVYGTAVYGKGALGFEAVRTALGDEAYFAGLREYVAAHQFGIAQPADLLAAFESASGRDVHPLWRHWFEATEGTLDYSTADLQRLLQSASG